MVLNAIEAESALVCSAASIMVLSAGVSMCGSCHTDMLLQVTSINSSGLGVYSLAAASIMLSQEAVSVSVSELELELEPASDSELKFGRGPRGGASCHSA